MHDSYLSESLIEFTVVKPAEAYPSLYVLTQDELAEVEAENGRFIQPHINVYNAGGDPVGYRSRPDFRLFSAGETYEHSSSIGEFYEIPDARDVHGRSILEPIERADDRIQPDRMRPVFPLFDVGGETDVVAVEITEALADPPDEPQYLRLPIQPVE